jgi:hypothetical protein
MPKLVKISHQYFDEKKRDIFLLDINSKKHEYDSCYGEVDFEQIRWFRENNIFYDEMGSMSMICGWTGLLYVDFEGHDDPLLKKYIEKYEDEKGMNRNPEHFQLKWMSYDEWVSKGGPEELKEWLEQDIY